MPVIIVALTMTGCANWEQKTHLHCVPTAYTKLPKRIHASILDTGWHTGWALPAKPVLSALPKIAPYFTHDRELLIGWGNRNFYMARNPGIGLALGALLPSKSVILIQGIHRKHWQHALLPKVRLLSLQLNRKRFWALVQYIARYMSTAPNGKLQPTSTNWYRNGWFFPSPGVYYAFHTCNTWTVQSLSRMGYPVSATGVLFANQVYRIWVKLRHR